MKMVGKGIIIRLPLKRFVAMKKGTYAQAFKIFAHDNILSVFS